jgi:hypothetical protein
MGGAPRHEDESPRVELELAVAELERRLSDPKPAVTPRERVARAAFSARQDTEADPVRGTRGSRVRASRSILRIIDGYTITCRNGLIAAM